MGAEEPRLHRARTVAVLVAAFAGGLGIPVVASGAGARPDRSGHQPCNPGSTVTALGRPPCPPPTTATATVTQTLTVTQTRTVTVPAAPSPQTRHAARRIPIAGRSVVVSVLRGVIYVRRPRARGYVRLAGSAVLPLGSGIDADRGTLGLLSAGSAGHTQHGVFHGATFVVAQSPTEPTGRAGRAAAHPAAATRLVTILRLRGGSFAGCDRDDATHFIRPPGVGTALARAARARPRHRRRHRYIRHLWSSDSGGAWTTVGGDAAATVRGTVWLTEDRCAGTYVYVKRGVVVVHDFVSGRRIRLTAGHSYLARVRDRV